MQRFICDSHIVNMQNNGSPYCSKPQWNLHSSLYDSLAYIVLYTCAATTLCEYYGIAWRAWHQKTYPTTRPTYRNTHKTWKKIRFTENYAGSTHINCINVTLFILYFSNWPHICHIRVHWMKNDTFGRLTGR